MAEALRIRAGDTRPSLRAKCLDVTGVPVNLAGATAQLLYKRSGGSLYTKAMTCETPYADGWTRYDWQSGDTSTAGPGTYQYTIRVTYGDGSTESFPGEGFGEFVIEAALT